MGQQGSRVDSKQMQPPQSQQTDAPQSTAAGLNCVLLMMDQYPIKLTALQCAQLYGCMSTKPRILRWADVIERGSGITFRKCVEAKVDIQKLYNMQRDLQQWIHYQKVSVEDCVDLAPWKPNPFLDFQCHIGDLVMRRHVLTHAVLVRGGVTFELLWDRFGLTPAVMALLRFTPEEWIELEMQEHHAEALSKKKELWESVFKERSYKEVLEGICRRKQQQQQQQQRLDTGSAKACYY